MTVNIGSLDRILRVVVGLALLAWALGYLPGYGASVWGWVGLVPLLTGLFGYCPAYSLIGFNTCRRA
jgi:hypothetical protein